jgi:hypothetical protein
MERTGQKSNCIASGTPVLLVLHTPREKCWGILDEITAAGVFLRGLDLNAFDDWVSAVVHEEPFMGFGSLFFPMWRVERIAKDESAGGVPSLCEQAEQRTGRTFAELFQTGSGLVEGSQEF